MRKIALLGLCVALFAASACASPFILRRGGGAANPGIYPPGVTSAGLQSVYNLSATAGVPAGTSLTNFAALSLPANISRSSVAGTYTGNQTLTSIDFTGYTVYVTVNGTVGSLSKSLITKPNTGQDQLLVLGQTQTGAGSGPVTMTADQITFDGTGATRVLADVVQVDSGSTLTATNSLFINSPRDPMISTGAATTLTGDYFGLMGTQSQAGDHQEMVFIHGGMAAFTSTFFDLRSSALPAATCTAPLFYKSTAAAIVATINTSIIAGAAANGCNYPIEVSSSGFTISLTITGSVLQKGTTTGQYVGPTYASGDITVTNGGGNYDYDTGQLIVGPLCNTVTHITCN